MRFSGSAVLLWLSLFLSAGYSHGEEKWTHYLSGNDIMDMAVRGNTLWCFNSGSVVSWNTREKSYSQIQLPKIFALFNESPFTSVGPDDSHWLVEKYKDYHGDSLYTVFQLDRYSKGEWSESGKILLKLADDALNTFFCDRNGNVWLGMNQGALQYDGSSWRRFSATNILMKPPRVVEVDDSGAVWVGTDDGLYRLWGGNWRRYATDEGLAGNNVRCILAAPDGTLWVGTGTGASRFDGAEWKTYTIEDGLSSNGINAMTVDRAGKIWLGTDNGVSCFDGSTWTAWKGDADYFIDKKVTGIAVDVSNRIWMIHRGIEKGATVFDGSQLKWYTTLNTDIPTDSVESVAAGSDGVLWFATGQGALRYDGVSWKTYTTGDGLASNGVKDIIVDRNNRPWFIFNQSEKAGVTHLGADGPVTFTTANGLRDNTVLSVAVTSDGAAWFGTRGELARYDGRSWEKYPVSNNRLSSRVTGIAEDPDGVLWFATGSGLTRFDGSSWRAFALDDSFLSDEVTAIFPQGNGTVWCMAGDKLTRFENGVFTAMPDPADSLKPKIPISQIVMDRDGVIWTDGCQSEETIDSKRKMLYFDGADWKTITVPWPSPLQKITKIVVDKDNVKWFATGSGLVRLENGSATIWRVDGPPRYPLWYITADQENEIWLSVGYPSLFTSYDGKDWKNFQAGFQETILVDSGNRKWFTVSNSLVCYDNHAWSEQKRPPKPYFINSQRVEIDETDVLWFMVQNYDTNLRELGSFDGSEWKMFGNGGLDLQNILYPVVDHSGTKWLIGQHTLVSFDGAQWKTYPEAPIPEGRSYRSIAVDRNDIKWITYGEGVLSFDGKTWRKYSAENGLPSRNVNSVFVDRRDVKWFGTGANPVSYDGTVWKVHETGNGINMGSILCMAADMDNRKWIVWNSGYSLSVLDDRPGADAGNIPFSFSLLGNYPNPFNAGTSIAFETSVRGAASLSVYDILGRKVREVNQGKLPVGRNAITWNGADDHGKRVSSGVYLYRVRFGGAEKTGRMLFLK